MTIQSVSLSCRSKAKTELQNPYRSRNDASDEFKKESAFKSAKEGQQASNDAKTSEAVAHDVTGISGADGSSPYLGHRKAREETRVAEGVGAAFVPISKNG